MEKVALTLKCLKVSKSTGLDKIPAKVLKITSSIIAPSLTFIFNLSLSSGIFMDDWKMLVCAWFIKVMTVVNYGEL